MAVELGNYQPPERNLDGVQWERVRKPLDSSYNAVHDELTAAYYDGKPFRTFGVLDKETFAKFHALVWHLYELALDDANTALSARDRYPDLTTAVNDAPVDKEGKPTGEKSRRETAIAELAKLSDDGITLDIA